MLNESKGNMYGFVTHTWNTVKGKCPHDCEYCYMKSFPQRDIRFDRNELNTKLGENNFIFVGSSCDMFANEIPTEWIKETLGHCLKFNNKYLFQTKNPSRVLQYKHYFPPNSIIGTTIETNRIFKQMGSTPDPETRSWMMALIKKEGYETMVTVEPIMDFDVPALVNLIKQCQPSWVNIGADSKQHSLPEPDGEKVNELVQELSKFTEVKLKYNIKRIWRRD